VNFLICSGSQFGFHNRLFSHGGFHFN
jgi:hypothetical protein